MNGNPDPCDLRLKARERIATCSPAIRRMPPEDVRRLAEELQVYQVELEMQNEELRSTQRELEQSRRQYAELYDFAPVGYLTLNNDGTILKANLQAARQLGRRRISLIGRPFHLELHHDYRNAFHRCLKKAFRTGEKQTCEVRLNGKEKPGSYVQLDSDIFEDEDGLRLLRTTITDISYRKHAEEDLKSYAEKLERSNRDLEKFAFVASHDLKEPLRKIKTFTDQINKRYAGSLKGEGLDLFERMRKAALRMEVLINDLLEYSRLATKSADFKPVDLKAVIGEVISDLELSIERTDASIETAHLPVIEACHFQMRQLFQNLLSNALKFHGKERPLIKIHARCSEAPDERGQSPGSARCLIFVQDNGIGFEDEYSDQIFGLFERLHGRSEYEGTGMGLAICRKIVERHGGTITARSTPGKGSTFIINLPVRQSRPG